MTTEQIDQGREQGVGRLFEGEAATHVHHRLQSLQLWRRGRARVQRRQCRMGHPCLRYRPRQQRVIRIRTAPRQ